MFMSETTKFRRILIFICQVSVLKKLTPNLILGRFLIHIGRALEIFLEQIHAQSIVMHTIC